MPAESPNHNDQMIMILHETVSMADPIEPGDDGGKDIHEAMPIGSVQNNRLPSVSPTGYTINGSSGFNSQWPSIKQISST
jgi:hypothetical protein